MDSPDHQYLEDAANAEMRRVLGLQQAAWRAEPNPSLQTRQDRIRRLIDAIKADSTRIEEALNADFGGRSSEETYALELLTAVTECRHAIKHLAKWMKPEGRAVSMMQWPAKAEILRQPLGVVGIVVPWNYPLYLAVSPLVGALGAGNRVMLKMSEFTPRLSRLFAEMIDKIFHQDEVHVINGSAAVAVQFSSLPFDHLLFTGSTSVGRHVMAAAAANLTPVTLELGGKSPTLIAEDAELDKVLPPLMFGKLTNAGQTCVAPDYVLLPATAEDEFIAQARRVVQRFFPSLHENPDYTCVINDRQAERLRRYLADAEAKGARLHPLHDETPPPGSRKFVPMIITGVTDDMLVMQEEIFGPLLPIKTYERFDEAINYVNAHPRPLALYLFSRDQRIIEQVLRNTISGGVVINDVMAHVACNDLPFGGVGASGIGYYHGKEGFDTFSKVKGVLYQGRINGAAIAHPPRRNGRLRRIAKFMLR